MLWAPPSRLDSRTGSLSSFLGTTTRRSCSRSQRASPRRFVGAEAGSTIPTVWMFFLRPSRPSPTAGGVSSGSGRTHSQSNSTIESEPLPFGTSSLGIPGLRKHAALRHSAASKSGCSILRCPWEGTLLSAGGAEIVRPAGGDRRTGVSRGTPGADNRHPQLFPATPRLRRPLPFPHKP
jgi:hypothetical protein